MAFTALVAPATCDCGAVLRLIAEVADQDSDGGAVQVGTLICDADHPWLDIRPLAVARAHPPREAALPAWLMADRVQRRPRPARAPARRRPRFWTWR